MGTTPEGLVKQKVRDVLDLCSCMYYHMPVQTGLGRPSLDFIGSHYGKFFAIETKVEKKDPTPRQLETIRQIQMAGGKVFVIRGLSDTSAFVDLVVWLQGNMTSGTAYQPPAQDTRVPI